MSMLLYTAYYILFCFEVCLVVYILGYSRMCIVYESKCNKYDKLKYAKM